MLTSKSRYFKDLYNKQVTEEMLQCLAKNLIYPDYANCQGNLSKGYPADIAKFILNKIDKDNLDAKIVILNDLSLHMYNLLTDAGFKKENILLAYGKWEKDSRSVKVSEDKKVYNIMKMFAKSNFVEFENDLSNIITLEEMFSLGIKFDYIIANPPYEIGNEITKAVLEKTSFEQYINLIPISKTKKDKIYQHIESVEVIPTTQKMFEDADTNPHIIMMQKQNNGKSWDDIQLTTYDQKWIKYYKEQLRREASWVRVSYPKRNEIEQLFNDNKTFALTLRTGVDGVHKTENCADADWNKAHILNLGSRGAAKSDRSWPCYNKEATTFMGEFSTFTSTTERDNIVDWWYNSKIASGIVRGLNKQSFPNTLLFLPKVDWTRPWTDEEILADYGYTEEEIEQILHFNDDLAKNNLKEESENEA